MTDIEQKALALVNEVAAFAVCEKLSFAPSHDLRDALCRAIERHEAFRQEVSDAVEWVVNSTYMPAPSEHKLRRFIIPKPVDPLVEAVNEMGLGLSETAAEEFRAAIEKRGGKIVWGEG